MKRVLRVVGAALVAVMVAASPAVACGGLVAPNGTINLLRTATAVAYLDGVEHYITSFEFAGGGAELGSIVPLPGIPSKVKRGGDWTLQRLQEEVAPPEPLFDGLGGADSAVSAESARVVLEKEIDALDITVLEGGGDAVGEWALENGFQLPPDAPEILDFYADRSPVFMAVRFDVARAVKLGRNVGDGIPIHLTIPTQQPWVPLRILGLGRQANEVIEADVFLLTEDEPSLLPAPRRGLKVEVSRPAGQPLLRDLASDKGMSWLPEDGMHLTYLRIDEEAGRLTHDLAIDPTGLGTPSYVAAGLAAPAVGWRAYDDPPWLTIVGMLMLGVGVVWFVGRPARRERWW